MFTVGEIAFEIDDAKSEIVALLGKNYRSSDWNDPLHWLVNVEAMPKDLRVKDYDGDDRDESFWPLFYGYPLGCSVSDWRDLSGRSFEIGNLGNGHGSGFYVQSHEDVYDCTISFAERHRLAFSVDLHGMTDVRTDYDTSAYGWGPSVPFRFRSKLSFRTAVVTVRPDVSDPGVAAIERIRGFLPTAVFAVEDVFPMGKEAGTVFGYQVHLRPTCDD